MNEIPTAADVLDDIQRICYRAIHEAAFNTSDKMLAALVPLIDRAKAAELRRLADVGYWCDDTDISQDIDCALRARADELDPPARQED